MVGYPHGETVTRIRPAPTDRWGDPIGSPTEVSLEGVAVAPRSSVEPGGLSTSVVTGYLLLIPYAADVKVTDRVECRGEVWDVDGEPFEYRHPMTGWEPGVQVLLKRAEGG